MKCASQIFAVALLLASLSAGFSQGFVNLDFEQAEIVSDPSQGNFFVYATNAIPNWTPYLDDMPQTDIAYNAITLDDPAVSIHGTNSPYITPIQGNYSIFLQGGTQYAYGTNSAIGQTGQIPLSAESLIYWGASYDALQITFAGQPLSFIDIGSTANYTIYGADISSFAGQTGQLLFTALQLGGGIVDNIQFSATPVPEPSELALSALGAVLFAFHRWKK